MVKDKQEIIQETEGIILDFKGIIDFTDNDKLFDFCVQNRDLRIERTREGKLNIMLPVGSEGGAKESLLTIELGIWNKTTKLGTVFGSSTGFTMPNGAMRSPDTAFIYKDRWESLSFIQKKKFAPICPDFIIELRSESDNINKLKEKMREWIANGCPLAWLIDPLEGKAYIYRPNKEIEEITSFSGKLSGENILPGFELDLSELREEE